jgi:dynein heavy chain
LKQGTHNVGLFDRPVSVASSNCEKQEKQFEWAEVGMLDYNEEKQLYLVRRMVWPKAGGGQTVDRKGPLPPTSFTQANPKTGCTGDNLHYWVPRVRLMFAAEDPVNFANRVEFAYRFRAKTEALIRYHLYIDCMPTDGVRELERGSLKRMINSACSSPVLKQSTVVNDYLQVLSREVNLDFLRAMNRIMFDSMVPSMLDIMSFVTLPEKEVEPVKESG